MKKRYALLLIVCLLVSGCTSSSSNEMQIYNKIVKNTLALDNYCLTNEMTSNSIDNVDVFKVIKEMNINKDQLIIEDTLIKDDLTDSFHVYEKDNKAYDQYNNVIVDNAEQFNLDRGYLDIGHFLFDEKNVISISRENNGLIVEYDNKIKKYVEQIVLSYFKQGENNPQITNFIINKVHITYDNNFLLKQYIIDYEMCLDKDERGAEYQIINTISKPNNNVFNVLDSEMMVVPEKQYISYCYFDCDKQDLVHNSVIHPENKLFTAYLFARCPNNTPDFKNPSNSYFLLYDSSEISYDDYLNGNHGNEIVVQELNNEYYWYDRTNELYYPYAYGDDDEVSAFCINVGNKQFMFFYDDYIYVD